MSTAKETKKRKAVVMGRNYTSVLGMVRSAGDAGCDVTIIRMVKKKPGKSKLKSKIKGAPIESKSKYVKGYYYSVEPKREKLVELLLSLFKAEKEKVVLLPTDDFTASTVDMFQDQLRPYFVYPNVKNKTGEVLRLMDKYTQKSLAMEAGLPVMKCWIAKGVDGKYEIPKEIEYPVFTKPEISFKGNKTFMRRCNSQKELAALLEEVQATLGNTDCPILIEEFAEIEKEYGVLGFSDGKNVFMPALIDKLATGHGRHKGVTLLGDVIPMQNYPELKEKLEALILSTEFTGLFDVDLYKNKGEICFNELNLRFGAFGYALTLAGVKLPGMCIRTLLGEPYDIPEALTKKIRCINDKVNLEDFEAGYISWKEYKNMYKEADARFVKSDTDKGPYKAFVGKEKRKKLKRLAKKVLK